MATLFLIRHGEPELSGVFLGHFDSPLRQPAAELAPVNVAVVYSSPLLRAKQTAESIPCVKRMVLHDLIEVDFGLWTGKTWGEIEAEWPHVAARKASDWLSAAAPGGEGWSSVLERARRVVEVIRRGPLPAAVVAHQGINAAIASLARGDDAASFEQKYGEVIRVELN